LPTDRFVLAAADAQAEPAPPIGEALVARGLIVESQLRWALETISFIVCNVLMIALNLLAVVRRRIYRLAPWALAAPLYWLLHSFAAWRALVQLVHNPYFWEKTPHGLARVDFLYGATLAEFMASLEYDEPERLSA
jgi:hypothetical protein